MKVTNAEMQAWNQWQRRVLEKKIQQERTAAALAVMKKPAQQKQARAG